MSQNIRNLYGKLIKEKVEEILTIKKTNEGWNLLKKGNFFNHSTIQYGQLELPLNKIQGIFPTNFQKTVDYFQECYENKERNEMCGQLELVERVDDNTIVAHFINQGKFIFSPRELIIVQNKHYIKENEEVLITRNSIDSHHLVAPNTKAVRADAKVYGIYLKKLNDYQTQFEAYLIVDLKGNMPNFANNMMIDKYISLFEKDIEYIKTH